MYLRKNETISYIIFMLYCYYEFCSNGKKHPALLDIHFRRKVNEPNTWIAFRKDIVLDKVPRQAIASIAADTKYWLWINGEPVVFEGAQARAQSA